MTENGAVSINPLTRTHNQRIVPAWGLSFLPYVKDGSSWSRSFPLVSGPRFPPGLRATTKPH
jgi:hypothetical protein